MGCKDQCSEHKYLLCSVVLLFVRMFQHCFVADMLFVKRNYVISYCSFECVMLMKT